jgi:hypothetical protein
LWILDAALPGGVVERSMRCALGPRHERANGGYWCEHRTPAARYGDCTVKRTSESGRNRSHKREEKMYYGGAAGLIVLVLLILLLTGRL